MKRREWPANDRMIVFVLWAVGSVLVVIVAVIVGAAVVVQK